MPLHPRFSSISTPPVVRYLCHLMVCLSLGALFTSCGFSVFHDAISTEIEVPSPNALIEDNNDDDGTDRYRVTASKRFRFERDVSAAASAFLDEAWIELVGENVVDLSSISQVRIFAIDPVTNERVPILEGRDFRPGDSFRDLEIVFNEDVRRFVTDEKRINIEWEIDLQRFYTQWENVNLATIGFGIVLEIEID